MQTVRVNSGVVCSAHAEVIPPAGESMPMPLRLLRTRGGDPGVHCCSFGVMMSAPHTRR